MKLILTGGGQGEQTTEIDSLFASFLDKSKPLLYIPVAMDIEVHPYDECLEWLKSTFVPLGVDKFEMFTEEKLDELNNLDLDNFSGVYIGGGNTFYLLNEMKKHCWNFFKESYDKTTYLWR